VFSKLIAIMKNVSNWNTMSIMGVMSGSVKPVETFDRFIVHRQRLPVTDPA
jgi:hypothetical protein